MPLDHTHDVQKCSWLDSAQDKNSDFPIQNLPFGIFRRRGSATAFRGGVAIGDQVIDLATLAAGSALHGHPELARQAAQACAQPVLNDFLAQGPPAWRALRHALFALLARGASPAQAAAVQAALVPQADVEHAVPTRIGDYTDFYTSYYHADNFGRIMRDVPPHEEVVSPNFHWIPLAYHGRASSIGVSGQRVRRPWGQSHAASADAPRVEPCAWLDYEMELGFYVGPGNEPGDSVPLAQAENHLFGVCLLNDWSARDIQFWEMAPLGPFLSKSLATTISPWIVTMDALAPFRGEWRRESRFPQPLPYLDNAQNQATGSIDIQLETLLETPARRARAMGPVRIAGTSFRHQHWTAAQMLTHHTMNGCNLQPGDLFGSGTVSGPTAGEAAAITELSKAGREPLRIDCGNGQFEERSFLADGDAVILRAWCEQAGFARIGFGQCRGEVLPAHSAMPTS